MMSKKQTKAQCSQHTRSLKQPKGQFLSGYTAMSFSEDGRWVPSGGTPLPLVHSGTFIHLKCASHKCLLSFSIPMGTSSWAIESA